MFYFGEWKKPEIFDGIEKFYKICSLNGTQQTEKLFKFCTKMLLLQKIKLHSHVKKSLVSKLCTYKLSVTIKFCEWIHFYLKIYATITD